MSNTVIIGRVLATALLTSSALAALAAPAAADTKIGLLTGITGPTAAQGPDMLKAYDLAVQQVNAGGGILKGEKLVGVVGDDGCNPQLAADSVGKIVNVSGAIAIVGPTCSGALISAANSVTIPAGILTVTPTATSPAITGLKDNDLVFRTITSDDYQGKALARALLKKGTKKVAVAYINNDYGKGLAQSFKGEFETGGGTIAGYAAHEEGKASYRSDLAELAKSGADTLMIFDYADGAGLTILREALENSFFTRFIGADGMKSKTPIKTLGAGNLNDFMVSASIGSASTALEAFNGALKKAGGDAGAAFVSNCYDAVFVTALAIEKAGGNKSKLSASLRAISSGKGEPVGPGEWAKAKALIGQGKDISYQGASGNLNFDAQGDVHGAFGLFKVVNGDFEMDSPIE